MRPPEVSGWCLRLMSPGADSLAANSAADGPVADGPVASGVSLGDVQGLRIHEV